MLAIHDIGPARRAELRRLSGAVPPFVLAVPHGPEAILYGPRPALEHQIQFVCNMGQDEIMLLGPWEPYEDPSAQLSPDWYRQKLEEVREAVQEIAGSRVQVRTHMAASTSAMHPRATDAWITCPDCRFTEPTNTWVRDCPSIRMLGGGSSLRCPTIGGYAMATIRSLAEQKVTQLTIVLHDDCKYRQALGLPYAPSRSEAAEILDMIREHSSSVGVEVFRADLHGRLIPLLHRTGAAEAFDPGFTLDLL